MCICFLLASQDHQSDDQGNDDDRPSGAKGYKDGSYGNDASDPSGQSLKFAIGEPKDSAQCTDSRARGLQALHASRLRWPDSEGDGTDDENDCADS